MTRTDPQRPERILEFVYTFRKTHAYGPSIREVQEAVGLANPSAALYLLRNLRSEGRLTWDERNGRMVAGSIALTYAAALR